MPSDSPYSESLAMATACSTVAKEVTGATGPKTSSAKAGAVSGVSASTVSVEEILVGATGCQFCSGRDASGDQGVDVVALFGVDDGSECDLTGERVAYRKLVGAFGKECGVIGGDAFVDELAAGGHADLPWCMNEPKAPTDAAFSRSTSSMTISALFPPSSRCARLRWRPASSPTARPARVDR